MDWLNFDYKSLLAQIGLPLAFLIIFAESSLIFFLPGDSFILVAGVLASQGYFNIWLLLIVMFIAAITGNNLGYFLGKKYGPRLFSRENHLLFDKNHIERAKSFYAKYGPITIVLARFTPMVRTLAPILAGVGHMNYQTFFFYNVIGAFLWVAGLGLVGYWAGGLIPNVDRYILPAVIIVIVLSVLPGLFSVLRNRNR